MGASCYRASRYVTALRLGMGWLTFVLLFAVKRDARANEDPASVPLSGARVASIARYLSETPRGLGPSCSNRTAWADAGSAFAVSVKRANAFLARPLPPWSDDDYLMASRTGDRSAGEEMLGAHDGQLSALVLAECTEWHGRYLARIEEELDAIAAQKTWTMPAHDLKLDSFSGRHHFVDLGAAATGHNVAEALYLLGDRLPDATRRRAMAGLETNVFGPMRRSFSGTDPEWWLSQANNWNAVCLNGAVGAALAVLPHRMDRALFAAAAVRYTRNFLNQTFRDTGYDDEGIGYWVYGFSNYMELREQLWLSTGGKVDLYDEERARRGALFPYEFQMLPGMYADFGDAGFMSGVSRGRLAAVDVAFGLGLSPDAAKIIRESVAGTSELPGAVLAVFPNASQWHGDVSGMISRVHGLRTYYGDVGILVDRPSAPDGLAITIKDGGNSSHSHNDVGSYSIGLRSTQIVGDPGGPRFYTVDTFTAKRYDSRLLNSFGHPVPEIGGHLQVEAPKVKPKVVSTSFSDAEDTIALDLTGAYDMPELKGLIRTMRYSRKGLGEVEIDDGFELKGPSEIEESFPTHGTCRQIDARTLQFDYQDAHLVVTVDGPTAFTLSQDRITDYGVSVDRVGAHLKLQGSGKIVMHFKPAQAK